MSAFTGLLPEPNTVNDLYTNFSIEKIGLDTFNKLFTVYKSNGDGSCMFHSLSGSLWDMYKQRASGKEIRNAVIIRRNAIEAEYRTDPANFFENAKNCILRDRPDVEAEFLKNYYAYTPYTEALEIDDMMDVIAKGEPSPPVNFKLKNNNPGDKDDWFDDKRTLKKNNHLDYSGEDKDYVIKLNSYREKTAKHTRMFEDMKNPATWGETEELVTSSIVLGCNIVSLSSVIIDGEKTFGIMRYMLHDTGRPPLFVLYTGGNHYSYLRMKGHDTSIERVDGKAFPDDKIEGMITEGAVISALADNQFVFMTAKTTSGGGTGRRRAVPWA
jgi:hypothetical protein